MSSTPLPARLRPSRPVRLALTLGAAAVLVGLGAGTWAARPADPSARLEKARDLTLAARPEEALREVVRALAELEETGSSELQLRALVRAAQITDFHLGEGRVKEALDWYRRIIEASPGSTEAFDAGVRVAEILKQRFGDDARASAQLVSVVDAFPGHSGTARLLLRAARLAVDASRFEDARAHAQRLIDEAPESAELPEAMAVIASTLHLEGRHAEAGEQWDAIAARFPGTPHGARALTEAGHCLEERFDYTQAMARFLEALPTHPDPFVVQKSLERVRQKFTTEQAKRPGSREYAFR